MLRCMVICCDRMDFYLCCAGAVKQVEGGGLC